MGERGPIPKRSDERERRNKPENSGGVAITKGQGYFDFDIPEPAEHWLDQTVDMYEAFYDSGESYWFQLTDWHTLWMLCEQIDRELRPQFVGMGNVWNETAGEMETKPIKMKVPMKGASLAALLKGLGSLGATEGDRRRMQMELQREETGLTPDQEAEQHVVDARARFGRGGSVAAG